MNAERASVHAARNDFLTLTLGSKPVCRLAGVYGRVYRPACASTLGYCYIVIEAVQPSIDVEQKIELFCWEIK